MNSRTYSVIVLLVLIVGEVSGILGRQLECDFWFVPIVISFVLSFLLAIVAWKHKHLRPNSGILANLVSSTISPSWLGIAFLMVFISHFTWWMDVVIEFFKPVSDERDSWYLLFFISSCGLIITGWFFPEGGIIPKDNKIRIEFPDKKEEIEALDICFTTPCDYDLFEECYTVLDEAVRHEDEPNAQLCFNLTPGTGIVGSLMTLFSIDADRLLFYYAQFTSDYRSNHERVQEAKKEKIHLESLLSQALQKLKLRK